MFTKSYKTGKTKKGGDYQSFTVDVAELKAELAKVQGERAKVVLFTSEHEGQRGPFTSATIIVDEVKEGSAQQGQGKAKRFEKKSTAPVRPSNTLNRVVE